jgi:ERCC4-type nuclease
VGLEDEVAVERKSKSDCYSSVGTERGRFVRELQRMAGLSHAAVVVEAPVEDFLVRPMFSQMSPVAAIRTLVAWSVKYGVHVHFAGSRPFGAAIVRNILEKYWHYRKSGVGGHG